MTGVNADQYNDLYEVKHQGNDVKGQGKEEVGTGKGSHKTVIIK